MSFINNPSTDLSRFSIGEIADLSGVSDFYNAGSSKWLKSATATVSSNLSTTTKTNLAAAGVPGAQTVLAQSSLSLSYNGFGFYATYPIQRISASSVSVVPAYYQGSSTVGVGVMTSAGLQAVATGQTSLRSSNTTTGTNAVVASDNTTIFSYCFSSATALSAAYTTNGTTWTIGTVTGLPTFAATSFTVAHASTISGDSYTTAGVQGYTRAFSSAGGQFMVFWCGARFVLIGPAATNYMVSLSTNGLAWGGDNTTAVIGATARAIALDMQFYRNGNNCYLNIGGAYRYSTDGGITWAASTFAAAPDPSSYVMQYNQSDPAKLIISAALGNQNAYYSANSGQTWSAVRTLPTTNTSGGLYYKGSTVVNSNASTLYYVSVDDGVTWTVPTFPIGVLSQTLVFYADANRFYAGITSQKQILTSSDAVTWTLVTLPQNFTLTLTGTTTGNGIIAYDSNTVVLIGASNAGSNQAIFTLDGGVTWTGAQFTVGNIGGTWGVGNVFVTPDAGGVAFVFSQVSLTTGSSTNVLKTDLTAGGAFYRTGASTISPARTNALAFVRVG